MHAIILAAGRGQRLRSSIPNARPKCLIEIAGKSLLSRQLEVLLDNGIKEIYLVLGFEAEQVIRYLANVDLKPRVNFLHNPDYERGSVLSLLTAREVLEAGSDVLVLDADVLFHPQILHCLCRSRHPNCFLLDRNFIPGEEPVKIAVRNKLMVEFRKALPPDLVFEVLGESVGFFRFDGTTAKQLSEICAQFAREAKGDLPHEEAIRQLLLGQPDRFGYEDVSGLPWIEIDFPEDVIRAERIICPAINKHPASKSTGRSHL